MKSYKEQVDADRRTDEVDRWNIFSELNDRGFDYRSIQPLVNHNSHQPLGCLTTPKL